MFHIQFQSEACLGEAYVLFRSQHLWIHNLRDLVVILNFLCYKYRKDPIQFLQLIVPG